MHRNTDSKEEGDMATVTGLAKSVDALRDEIATERKSNEKTAMANLKREKRLTAAVFISIIVALGSLFAASKAVNASDEANHVAVSLITNRTQARINTCLSFNDFASKHNQLINSSIDERLGIIETTKTNPLTTQEQKDAQVAFFEKTIEDYRGQLVTLRDCSEDSVNEFYSATQQSSSN